MTHVQCKSEVTADSGDFLTVADIRDWVIDLPADAQLTAITRDLGNQRDPWHVTVGLTAKWTEDRV